MTARDPYEVLGVARAASQDEIKTAYRRLAREHHPDVNPNNPEAEEKFKEIGTAYNILSDPDKRARFDQFGTVDEMPQDPFFNGSMAINDIFDMFFGSMGGGNARSRSAFNGSDIQTRVELELKDVLHGVDREVSVARQIQCSDCNGTGVEGGGPPESCQQCGGVGAVSRIQQTFIGQVRTQTTCPVCGGAGTIIKNPCHGCRGKRLVPQKATLKVTIPAGVENGTSLRLTGKGNEGIGGGRPGDLYVGLVVHDDSRFERDGNELHTSVDITYAQAALGDELLVEGLDENYAVDLPTTSQPDQVLTVRNAGLPHLHGGRRGNMYVHVNLVVPGKLNDEQRELLIKLAEAGGEPIPKGEKGGILAACSKRNVEKLD